MTSFLPEPQDPLISFGQCPIEIEFPEIGLSGAEQQCIPRVFRKLGEIIAGSSDHQIPTLDRIRRKRPMPCEAQFYGQGKASL
jgi:hypothetical protein